MHATDPIARPSLSACQTEAHMIVEYIRYSIEPSRAKEFLSAYEEASKSLKESSHCLAYELTQCTEDRKVFILRIQWDSAEGHMRGFRTSPQFKPFFSAIQPFVKDILEMRHYERTPLEWSR
jgi:quinol monooxygenase YgiN